jgi:hypothetical protein
LAKLPENIYDKLKSDIQTCDEAAISQLGERFENMAELSKRFFYTPTPGSHYGTNICCL